MGSVRADAILYYAEHPEMFVRGILKIDPTPQQDIVLKNLHQSLLDGKSIAVKSGHGTGKTAMQSWIILWFMFTRPFPKIVATAPTARQLFDVLWAELSKWYQDNDMLKQMFEWTNTRFVNKRYPKNWFASARTSNKPEAMAGIHSEHVLYIIDEASGVEDKVFEVIEGGQTESGSLQIMFSNPTQISGGFYDAFNTKREFFRCFTFSCLESPRVRPEYGEKIAAKYGKDSDVYRVRVLGEFPKAEPDSVIPLSLVEKAIAREVQPEDYDTDIVEIGADIARYGDDANTIWSRVGKKIVFEEEIRKQDIMTVAHRIAHIRRNKYSEYKAVMNIDVVGIGAGVVDRLEEMQKEGTLLKDDIINGVNNAKRARDSKNYANLVTEMWFNFKEFLEEGGQIPDVTELIGELTTRKYGFDSKNKQIIEKKDMVKKRLGKSPDYADGCILTTYTLLYDINKMTATPMQKPGTTKTTIPDDFNKNILSRIEYYKKMSRRR